MSLISPIYFAQWALYIFLHKMTMICFLIIILMEPSRGKQSSLRKKANPLQNPELTTAQMTLGRTTTIKPVLSSEETPLNHKDILEQAEELWAANDMLESINLMKGLLEYLIGIKFGEHQVLAQVYTNLAVSYYKIGFLEEADEEFASALSIIKEASLGLRSTNSNIKGQQLLVKHAQKIKYDMLSARIQLQVCILFSEMGKHEKALENARNVCKLTYNMIYDLTILLYQHLHFFLNKGRNNYANAYAPDNQLICEGHQELINNIVILEQLLSVTKDFKQEFISKDKAQMLDEERYTIKKVGKLPSKVDMDLLYALTPENIDSLWVFKNKILDQIQMKFIKEDVFDCKSILQNNEVIQRIVYLAISLYCYSTETRFLEKNKDNADPSEVLDSEHWLSRSLEIAYSFLPHQAPILNQILTVHDRFHGIDKQTIPQDKEVGGFFKVLRPLSKPKTTYSSKNIMCSPIMIRIQVPKLDLEIKELDQENSSTHFQSATKAVKLHSNKLQLANKTIDLDSLTKNNKIRGLNNNTKKYDFIQASQSTIRQKNNTKTDFTEHLKNIYATRKIKSVVEHTKNDRMKINLAGISNAEGGVKSMRRPHSYDKQMNKSQEPPHHMIQTQRKKKSVSLHRKETRKRSNTTSNSTTLKLDGLQMLPKKNLQDEQFQFSGRISNVETSKYGGGNIFINNNINLFISKQSKQISNGKELSTKNGQKTAYEIGRRQNYMNKRRAHNSVFTGVTKNPQFPI